MVLQVRRSSLTIASPPYHLTVSGSLMFLAAICALLLSVSTPLSGRSHSDRREPVQISYQWDNVRRNKQYGEPDLDERVDTSELADKVCVYRPCMHFGTVFHAVRRPLRSGIYPKLQHRNPWGFNIRV